MYYSLTYINFSQVVKNTQTSCYVEFSFIDGDVIKSKKIGDLIKKAEADLAKSHKGLIQKIVNFDHAERFVCKEKPFPICS